MPDMDDFTACRELTHNERTKHIPMAVVRDKDQNSIKFGQNYKV